VVGLTRIGAVNGPLMRWILGRSPTKMCGGDQPVSDDAEAQLKRHLVPALPPAILPNESHVRPMVPHFELSTIDPNSATDQSSGQWATGRTARLPTAHPRCRSASWEKIDSRGRIVFPQ
jgi:hypothetical protein